MEVIEAIWEWFQARWADLVNMVDPWILLVVGARIVAPYLPSPYVTEQIFDTLREIPPLISRIALLDHFIDLPFFLGLTGLAMMVTVAFLLVWAWRGVKALIPVIG